MPVLFIDEEYGYKHWIADLTDEEWQALQQRWRTIKGMSCLVPVRFLVPKAKLIEWGADVDGPEFAKKFHECRDRATVFAHFHEYDDSSLTGCHDYKIPRGDSDGYDFEVDGRKYTHQELVALMEADRANPPELA